MKLMVLGQARHGKDTVCEILHAQYGLRFISSSYFVAEEAVRPYLAAMGITYESLDLMYIDRVHHRDKWFTAIREYNKEDPTKLARKLYADFDIYCGIRDRRELLALQAEGVVDFTMWVDASRRMPPEPSSSITVTMADADHIIDNNGTLSELRGQVSVAMIAARAYARKK